MSFTPTDEQQAIFDAVGNGRHMLIEAGAGSGKALHEDEPVLTAHGWSPIKNLRPGDRVVGSDGLAYDVLGVYPQGSRRLYNVTFSDGTTVKADADHIWTVQHHKDRDRAIDRWRNLTTEQIVTGGVTRSNGGGKWFIPMPQPVKFPERDLPMDPWLLGVLLGDGNLEGTPTVTTVDPYIIDRVRDLVEPMGVTVTRPPSSQIEYRLGGAQTRAGRRGFWNPIVDSLRELGLRDKRSWDKFIPEPYLLASADQRLDLLRGLLDTDGCRTPGPLAAEFGSASRRLAEGVMWLAQSLGGTARMTVKNTSHRDCYRVAIRMPATLPPFALPRKADGWGADPRFGPYRTIRSIVPAGVGKAVCIEVASPDRLYMTRNGVLTHNTTTLRGIANLPVMQHKDGIYLAYNRAVADDARKSFPGNVTANTVHSFCLRPVAQALPFVYERLNMPKQPAWKKAELMGVTSQGKVGDALLPPKTLARIAWDTLIRWSHSADETIESRHVPVQTGLEAPEHRKALAAYALPLARKMWDDVLNPTGKLRWEHDFYVKEAQRRRIRFGADFMFLDEAQDSNGVTIEIARTQAAAGTQLIVVGDRNQQLYAWRGATSAMDAFRGDADLFFLSKSFRFGPALAAEANKWLAALDAELRITGHDPVPTTIGPVEHGTEDAILCRTNAEALRQVMALQERNVPVALVDGKNPGKAMLELAKACDEFRAKGASWHPDLQAFRTWGEVQDYAENEGSEFATAVKLIDQYGTDAIIEAVEQLVPEDRAAVTVSTAHRSKGREWDTVRIADDFRAPTPDDNGRLTVNTGEAMLAYVAVTRARLRLDRGPLEYVDDLLGGHRAPAPAPIRPEPAPEPAVCGAPRLDGRYPAMTCGKAPHGPDVLHGPGPNHHYSQQPGLEWANPAREKVSAES